jgi:hypothetical protein
MADNKGKCCGTCAEWRYWRTETHRFGHCQAPYEHEEPIDAPDSIRVERDLMTEGEGTNCPCYRAKEEG